MSLLTRFAERRRLRRHDNQRPTGAAGPTGPVAQSPASPEPPAVATSTFRHGNCTVKHRTAEAASRCRNA